MKPTAFAYHAPKTIEAAVELLAELAPLGGRILAGGQSLVPILAFRLATPEHLIDINQISDLAGLRRAPGRIAIGAGTRHAVFERAAVEGVAGRLLTSMCVHVAHGPIRARGTFGGSIAHADPASEWCLLALALGATMVARRVGGSRRIAAAEFFRDIMTTALEPDELLVAVELPDLLPGTCVGFHEFSRRPGDFAIAMALATLRIENGRIVDPVIGIGGVEPVPARMSAAEAELRGRQPTAAVFGAAAAATAAALDPMEDSRITAEFRREVAAVCVRRALAACLA